MNNENVLAELRAWRDEFARSHGYDLRAMAAALRELDNTFAGKVVRGVPRRPVALLPVRTGAPIQGKGNGAG